VVLNIESYQPKNIVNIIHHSTLKTFFGYEILIKNVRYCGPPKYLRDPPDGRGPQAEKHCFKAILM
jgi:hypothetical protein